MGRRIRTIKPEWLEDGRLLQLSDHARLLSIAFIVMADDHGNGQAEGRLLATRVWPYLPRDEAEKRCQSGCDELSAMGFVSFYVSNGEQLYHITNWTKHQKISNPSKPVVKPPPSEILENSRKFSQDFLECATFREGKGKEGNGVDTREPEKRPPKRGTRIPPDWTPPDSIYEYACDNPKVRFGTQAVQDHLEEFRDYWVANSTPNAVKRDWTAAFRTWLRKARGYSPDAPKSVPGAWSRRLATGAPIVKQQRISKRQYVEMMESIGEPPDGWVDDPGPYLYPHPEDA